MIGAWSPGERRDHARDVYRLCFRGGKRTVRIFRVREGALSVSSFVIDRTWLLLGTDDDFWATRAYFMLRDNYNRPHVRVRHSDLRRIDEDTAYRSDCPECGLGVLLVQRDQTTLVLLRSDLCARCWTRFWYTDETINGEKLYGR